MWFSNLIIYRFTKTIPFSLEELEKALSENVFHPCSAHEAARTGWGKPIPSEDSPHVHACNNYWMVCFTKQEKILPASVINDELAIRIQSIESQQHRNVARKEKLELKEQITTELLPKAFTKTVKHFAYINSASGYIVINTASNALADELTSNLRKACGSLPIRLLDVAAHPGAVMTEWLTETAAVPDGFSLNAESELVSHGEEKASIRYKGMDVDKEQVNQNTALGFKVKKQAINWNDCLSFVLQDDLQIKKLRFLQTIQDKLDDIQADTDEQRFDAGFSIMTLEIDRLIPALTHCFGGEHIAPSKERQAA